MNRRVTNPLARRVAGRLPGFAIVVHKGRKTGKEFRTPVNAFESVEGYLISLTYGSNSDWVKNVVAAGGCELETRGDVIRLSDPIVVKDASVRHELPAVVRPALAAIGVDEFMRLAVTETDGG